MNEKRTKRHFTADEKVAILKRHFVDKVPLSQLCDELGISPSLFYVWQKTFFENGAVAFTANDGRKSHGNSQIIKENNALKEKLRRKDEVLGELMEEHIKLKKNLGEI